MAKQLFLLLLFTTAPVFSQVVNDTIWLNETKLVSPKSNAVSYILATETKENTAFEIVEFDHNTNKMVQKGHGKINNNTLLYEGEVNYFDLNGHKTTTQLYLNGIVTKRTAYRNDGKTSHILSITYYKNALPTKTEYFNVDGSLKSELTYRKNKSTPDNGVAYEQNTITTYKNGVALNTQELYDNGKLFKQITKNQATYYDQKGAVLSTVSYKNGLPFEGKVYEIDKGKNSYANYIKGKKEGEEIIYTTSEADVVQKNRYNNGIKLKEQYYSNGKIIKEYPIVNDLVDGEARFYDAKGVEISTLTFKQGLPVNGASITLTTKYIIKQIFKAGNISSVVYLDLDQKPLMEEWKIDNHTIERQILENENEVGYKYQLRDDKLHGPYAYYENGKTKYEATFNEGKLILGTIVVFNTNSAKSLNTKSLVYTVLTATKEATKIQRYNIATNKLVFEMTSDKAKQNANPLLVLDSGIPTSVLYPVSELNNPENTD